MSKLAKALTAAAGNAAGESLYVEDVFSTYLYEGNGATQTITNGIDLDGEGGLVWIKNRGAATTDHRLFDTNRGIYKSVSSNLTDAEDTSTSSLTAFNSSGFSLSGFNAEINDTGNTYASWTFRKAEKFFDVVTWTGDGTAGRQIAHNLGSAPAVIIIKSVSFANNWLYNYNFGGSGYDLLYLDLTNSKSSQTYASGAIQAQPTDSSFTLKNSSSVNGSGNTYVAYLFASDAGGFGDDGSESIIKCGSAAATGLTTVDCGFEPQWVLIKSATVSNSWYIFDSMRGLHATGIGPQTLNPNLSSAEYTESADTCNLTSTGFTFNSARFNGNATYIYIAIRRPMKTPESGTEVFAIDTYGSTGDGNAPALRSPFVVDMYFQTEVDATDHKRFRSRLTGNKYLYSSATNAEAGSSLSTDFAFNNGVFNYTGSLSDNYGWMFKRATGFFDVVAYTGDGNYHDWNHNLGVLPEMMIVKRRSSAASWYVWHEGQGADNSYQYLQTTSGIVGYKYSFFNSGANTTTTIRTGNSLNGLGDSYVCYLFATLAGVSKVGSYTGNGTSQTIDCGFAAGARFILIKRTDSTGDWYVWDSTRGIVAGNDPHLSLNSTAAEVTTDDSIDPASSGFIVNQVSATNINVSSASYIYLSIA